ncbi:uncharacterized protein [Palaemon carinicauda]|uniref:uncharacterized protein n=1 Tax=Palaemon carinicauda TaxID=392227 RepID=UPI0035B634F1
MTRESSARLNFMLNGELLQEVDQFKYLGSVVATNAGVETDERQRVNDGCKVLGAVKRVVKNRGLEMNVERFLYEKVIVPTLRYGSELWGMKVTEAEIECVRDEMSEEYGW